MKQYYSWPELGDTVTYKGTTGKVVSHNMGELFFTIHADVGNFYNVDLADFVFDQIRNNC